MYIYICIYCTEVIYYSLKLFIAHNPLKHVFLVPVISRDHPSSGHNHDTTSCSNLRGVLPNIYPTIFNHFDGTYDVLILENVGVSSGKPT